MTTLTITKAYGTGQPLLEAHVDNFRNGLHTLLNVNKLDSSNFTSASISSDKFIGNTLIADNVLIEFGATPDAFFGTDASGNIVFDTVDASATDIEFTSMTSTFLDDVADIKLVGSIIFKDGGADRSLFQAFSIYKKPVLVYESPTSVSIQNNSAEETETVIYFPETVIAVQENTGSSAKYRTSDITNTANGYQAVTTGAARGGRRSGVSLTTNAWYYVYAVELRSGSDYDSNIGRFILVYDDTAPTVSNESALDGFYGSESWVYLGVIRYGFGAVGSNAVIPRFKYTNKGWCQFYEKGSTGMAGVNLVHSTSNSGNDPFYTVSISRVGNAIPEIIGTGQFNISRNNVSDWWVKDVSGDIIWQGGWQTDVSSLPHGFQLELPVEEYSFHHTTKGTSSVSKSITLTGFCDSYFTLRRQGTGI